MEINTLRSVVTVVTFLVFIGIVAWAWSGRNAKSFDEAAQLPFNQVVLRGGYFVGGHICLSAAAVVQRPGQGHDRQ